MSIRLLIFINNTHVAHQRPVIALYWIFSQNRPLNPETASQNTIYNVPLKIYT